MKSIVFILLIVSAVSLLAQIKLLEDIATLSPDDPKATRLSSSAVTLMQAGSNVTVSAKIRHWPNLIGIQKDQWVTNGTHILGFVVATQGTGKGVAQEAVISWQILNASTQDVQNLKVLRFPDIATHIDSFTNE